MGKYVGGIEGSVEIDIKSAQSSIRKLSSELKQLEQNYKTVTDVASSGDPLKELAAGAESYKSKLTEVKLRVKELKAELKSTGSTDTDKLTSQLKTSEKEARELTSALKTLTQVKEALASTGDIKIVSMDFLSQIGKANESINALKNNLTSIKNTSTAITPEVAKPAEAIVKANKKASVSLESLIGELTMLKNLYKTVSEGDGSQVSLGLDAAKASTKEYTAELKSAKREVAALDKLQQQLAQTDSGASNAVLVDIEHKIIEYKSIISELKAALVESKSMQKLLSTAGTSTNQAEQLHSIQQAIGLRETELSKLGHTKDNEKEILSLEERRARAIANIASVEEKMAKAADGIKANQTAKANEYLQREQAEINLLRQRGVAEAQATAIAENRRRAQSVDTQAGLNIMDVAQETQALEREMLAASAAARAEEALTVDIHSRNMALNETPRVTVESIVPDAHSFDNTTKEIRATNSELISCEAKINTLRSSLNSVDGANLASINEALKQQELRVTEVSAAYNRLAHTSVTDTSVSPDDLAIAREIYMLEQERLVILQQSANTMLQAGQMSASAIRDTISAEETRIASLRSKLAELQYTAANASNSLGPSIVVEDIAGPSTAKLKETEAEIRIVTRELAECKNGIVALNSALDSTDGESLSGVTNSLQQQQQLVNNLKTSLRELRAARASGANVSAEDIASARETYLLERQRLNLLQQSSNIMLQAGQMGASAIRDVITAEEARIIALQSRLTELQYTANIASGGASPINLTAPVAQATRLEATIGRIGSLFSGKLSPSISTMASQFRAIGSTLSSGFSRAYAQDIEKAKQSADNSRSSFKDISRVVSGILISQTFYRALGYVQDMLASIKEINQLTDEMNISFSTMFKDTEMGASFTKELKAFAAITPYSFADVSQNARMLSAYGFEANELLPVMQKLSDASAAMGNSGSFERVARAFGQMRTKGRLMQEELRQLNEAGVRTTDILMEKLGLTADQMAKIGDLKIPADTAINALLAGMTEQYSGASALMAQTIGGLTSTIKDNMAIIGEEVSAGFFSSFKTILTNFSQAAADASLEMQEVGFGGWLNNHFSAEDASLIRNLAANVKLLFSRFKELGAALAPIAKEFLRWMVIVANLVLPVINAVNYVVVQLIKAFLGLSPVIQQLIGLFFAFAIVMKVAVMFYTLTVAMKALFFASRILAPALIIVAESVKILAIACTKSIWVLLLTAAAAALIYFALKSQWATGLIDKLSTSMNKLFNNDPSDYFAPVDSTTKEWGDYSDNLDNATSNMEDLGDATKDAGKEAKNALASFDEVFQLNNPDESTNLAMPNIGDMGSYDLPLTADLDLSDITLPTTGSLSDFISEKFTNALKGAGIGAIIGGLIGLALGGPIGAKIGATIGAGLGALAGYFWDTMSIELQNAFKGAGIGAIVGGLVGLIFGQPILGAAIGAGLGALVGYIWEELGTALQESFAGAGLGAIIGGLIGLCFGNPLLGALLGTAIAGLIGYFWEPLVEFFTVTIPNAWNGVVDWFAAIPAWFGALLDSIAQYFINGWNSIIEFIAVTIPATINNIITWFGELPAKIGYIIGLVLGSFVKGFLDIGTFLSVTVPAIILDIVTWFSELPLKLGVWLAITLTNIITWGLDMRDKTLTAVRELVEGVGTWFSELPTRIGLWLVSTLTNMITWGQDLKGVLSQAAQSAVDGLVFCFITIPDKMREIGKHILSGLWEGVVDGTSVILNKIGQFSDGLVAGFKAAFDINSPSRVMKREVGTYIGQGLILGVQDSLTGLNGIIKDTVSAATNGVSFKTAVANTIETTQDTKNQATITTAGAMLSDMLNLVLTGFFDNLYAGFSWLSEKVGALFSVDTSSYSGALKMATSVPNVASVPSAAVANSNYQSTPSAVGSKSQSGNDIEAIVKAVTSAMENMPTPIFAGNIIADQRSLKELNITLKKIDKEGERRNG